LSIMEPLQLNGKLGCLLIQLPPSNEYNPKNLEAFFQTLPPKFKFAVEFRNLSWMRDETWQLLKEHNVAYTNVDEPCLPPEVHITADFAYFRWHGKGENPWFDYLYKEEELKPWIPRVLEASQKVKQVYGYFNNHYHGYAPENCLNLTEKILGLSDQQEKTKRKMSRKQTGLADFLQSA